MQRHVVHHFCLPSFNLIFLLWVIAPSTAQQLISLPTATGGQKYTIDLSSYVEPGTGMPPLHFKLGEGSQLLDGFTLEEQGILRGEPKARNEPYSFSILISDDDNPPQHVSQNFQLKVAAAPLRLKPQASNADGGPSSPSGSAPPNLPNPSASQDSTVTPVSPPTPTSNTKGKDSSSTSQAPVSPLLAPVFSTSASITGRAYPSSTIKVFYGPYVLTGNADKQGLFNISIPTEKPIHAGEEVVATQAVNNVVSDSSAPVTVQQAQRHGEISSAIIGYEQAGASAAQSKQNAFFNFFISRPLPFRHKTTDDKPEDVFNDQWDPQFRWWGNVRVASFPQQLNTPVASLAATFATSLGSIKVNQLAQSAEFVTGLEYRLPRQTNIPLLAQTENSRHRMELSLFAAFGATGPLDPKSTLNIFQVPATNSFQRQRFVQTFGNTVASATYVGFISPDRDRFFRTYFAGFRLTTHYADERTGVAYAAAPALVSVSAGQNEIVTGGRLSGVVGRFEAFYPLPFGSRSGLFSGMYLFGTAMMKIAGSHNIQPFVLAPAPSSVQGSDPNVAIVTTPSTRDIYRIGVGVDAVSVVRCWLKSCGSGSTQKNNNGGSPSGGPKVGTEQSGSPAAGSKPTTDQNSNATPNQ